MESPNIEQKSDVRHVITRADFMAVANEMTTPENAVKIWRAAGGEPYYSRQDEASVGPDHPIMNDELDLDELCVRIRSAEAGEVESRAMLSSPIRWNVYSKVLNTYLSEAGEVVMLPWDEEIHVGIRSRNLSRVVGAVAMLEAKYETDDSQLKLF